MSQFGYSQLEEDASTSVPVSSDASWTATFDDVTSTSKADDVTQQQQKSLTDEQTLKRPSADVSPLPASPSHRTGKPDSPSKHTDAKYTPLTKTGVTELGCLEDSESTEGCDECGGGDRVVFDSFVRITDPASHKSQYVTRFQCVILGLLASCVALVTVGLVYVFVILPQNKGEIVYPDGKLHVGDLARLRSLGEGVVVTSCGLVRGERSDGAFSFRGIPYALPPVGEGRWRPPVELSYGSGSCWGDSVLNATHWGSQCVQPRYNAPSVTEGSEDCLYMNVFTPDLTPPQPLPVIVWIHSGDFVYGSGHMVGMSPGPRVAKETNAVYVSFNFRLGAFGFLAMEELRSGEDGTAGNYGLMDQLAALRWVRSNIVHFGGDANQITVLGHGSGATSIQALLSSPHSTGLFHRAWISSPTALLNKTAGEAFRDNRKFLHLSGCDDVTCMRALTPTQVSTSSPWSLDPHWTVEQLINPTGTQLRNHLAIYDGHVVHWSKSHDGPWGTDVPVVFGTSYFELSALTDSSPNLWNLTRDAYHDFIAHHVTSSLGTSAVLEAIKLYSRVSPTPYYTSPAHFPSRPSSQLCHMVGDVSHVCPLKLLADTFTYVHSSPAWLYVTELYPSHRMRQADSLAASFVGWDMLALFDGFEELSFSAGQGDFNFKNIVREEVMSFARTGKPDAKRWEALPGNAGVIGRGVTVEKAEERYFRRCEFWKKHGFFGYTWMEDLSSYNF